MDVVAVEALDRRRDGDAAVVDEVQELSVHDRAVAMQVARGRRGQPVALGPAEGDVDERAGHPFLYTDRQAREQRQLRARPAEQRLGLEDQAAPHRDVGLAAGLGVAVVPEAFAGLSGSVGLSLSSPGATRTIGLTWRTDRPLAPPARRLLDVARDGTWQE